MQRTTPKSGQSCAQGFTSSSYPTVCLSVLDARARWQEPGVTITTDRLGRRCLEPTLFGVKDSFVKNPRWSHAPACFGALLVHGRSDLPALRGWAMKPANPPRCRQARSSLRAPSVQEWHSGRPLPGRDLQAGGAHPCPRTTPLLSGQTILGSTEPMA